MERKQVVEKLNHPSGEMIFDKDELLYIVEDWISLQSKCPIKEAQIGPTYELLGIPLFFDIKIDKSKTVNY